MDRTVLEVVEDALKLPQDDQFKLARIILESAQCEPGVDVDNAWEMEIQRRIAVLNAGSAKVRPFSEALQDLDNRLKRR